MSQNVNLSISGLYTSLSDYQGLPQGAMDVADNVEIRYKNVMEPRRGFEGLLNADVDGVHFVRLGNFPILGLDSIIGLTNNGDLTYYTGASPWPAVPGFSSGIVAPDLINAKSRFIQAGQNLYVTAQDGVRSICSGSSCQIVRAGVPKALDLQGSTNGDTSGFFSNNIQVTTTGNVTNTSDMITGVDDTTGITIGQYVSGLGIPTGTKVSVITPSATVLVEAAATTAGSTTLGSVAGAGALSVGMLVTGVGIQDGTIVSALPGGTNVTLSIAAYQTGTPDITFLSAPVITMDHTAIGSHTGTTLVFYTGAQVGYRLLFGRVEIDINGTFTTLIGAPSSVAIVINTLGTTTNTIITGTLPKNASDSITFLRLYRSPQTDSDSISPLDQYNLVYERTLTAADFIARTVTITDNVPDSLVGIPLYTGSDQEGALQANDPPPLCWDMCSFRDFVLYFNTTRPSSTIFAIAAAGPTGGVQVGDQINISGNFLGTLFSQNYVGISGPEVPTSREFQIVTSGSPSQNIADTTNSLIRVINYDQAVPVHAILISTTTDLPGQILLEADYPSYDTFFVNASAHQNAYDPTLTNIESDVNSINNGVAVSKINELAAVPVTNLFYAGNNSSEILRGIALRDYVIVLKSDGIYKAQGITPSTLIISPFDFTTKIIGSETAVNLNSAVWMLSSQGVVSISDGGVEAKSVPIDDQLNELINSNLDDLTNLSFGVAYESDRKYILSVPFGTESATDVQYNFNYVTNTWTTWSRMFYTGFIHSNEGKLYVSRADGSDMIQGEGVSRERKTGNYKDFVDESIPKTILLVDGVKITLDSVDDVDAGDILFQTSSIFSPIIAVDIDTNIVTIQYEVDFATSATDILKSYPCTMTWKQVFGDNPAFMRQFSEGMALFKNTRFNFATASFVTDFSQSIESVTLSGLGTGLWGLFPWGSIPWGNSILPSKIRFLIPQNKQVGSYLIPSLLIQQGYSDFKVQGMSISYYNISQESGIT